MNGVINVYKPEGITSFDVVARVRKLSKIKKVGHTGTLDPAARGILPVCLGRATKVIDYIMNATKTYRVELKLGVITDTYDREGKVIEEKEVEATKDDIKETILSFVGESLQVPPMFSALKVNGKRMYELARKGIEVEREARKIIIHKINIIDIDGVYARFEVCCSKGTYIRSLCYDIGEKLGCGGMMNDLERTATGPFNKENCVELKDLNEENFKEHLLSLDEVLKEYEAVTVNDILAKLLINGVTVQDKTLISDIKDDNLYRIYNSENKLLGLALKKKDGFKMVNLLI
jgi:tRNA pseudouridine55 synthase